LAEIEERVPGLDEQRLQAQAQAQEAQQAVARLDARLAALARLQEDVQKQGALEPWLAKHELQTLGRLWQKLHVETGWETALESILRERMTALELRQLDHARAFAADAPPARLAFYQTPVAGPVEQGANGLTLLSSMLRLNDPDLRSLVAGWLRDVYIADDMPQALAAREQLPSGAMFVLRDGHQIDRHSVRFYAPDSEQAGMLARQQEMENLRRDVKARQLQADQATSAVAQAEAAWRNAAQAVQPARVRVGELTQRLHDIQLQYSRLKQLAEQTGERTTRIREDLAEVAIQKEEALAAREDAEG